MGQKTHPIGFRLNVNKGWNSVWFAEKNNFSEPLEEDGNLVKVVHHKPKDPNDTL